MHKNCLCSVQSIPFIFIGANPLLPIVLLPTHSAAPDTAFSVAATTIRR